jgi:uncharacterized tellurite resistance protein B-like protein
MTRTPNEQEDEIILEVLCCVMVVDKTASAAEKTHIHTILSEDGSKWTTAEVNDRIKKFIARVEAQGFWSTLDDACDKASVLPLSRVEKLVQNCITLAKGDSEFHDRERKAIGRILKKLPQLQLGEISSQQDDSTPTYDVAAADPRSGQPLGKPSIEPQPEDIDVPIKHTTGWVVAAVFSCVFLVGALLIPGDAPIFFLINRGWMILLAIFLPLVIAYLARRRRIERADRREMVIYVESAYQYEHAVRDSNGNDTGRTRKGAYEFRTTEFGCVRVPSRIYYKVRPNRWAVVVASTVYGLKIANVIRTARPTEDFWD